MRVGLFATVLLAAGLSIRAAYAIPVHVDIGYSVNTSRGGFPGLANVALSLDYDTDAIAIGASRYPLLSAAGTINGTALAILDGFIDIANDVPFTPPRDRIAFFTLVNQAFGGVTLQTLGLVLEGPAHLFDAGAGPFVIDPEDFTIKQAFVAWESGSGPFSASSFSPTITVNGIPEPGTLLLISAGLLGLGLGRHRRSLSA
jgi:hypothetical protein